MLSTKKFLEKISKELQAKQGYYSKEYLEDLAERVDEYYDARVNLSLNEENALLLLSEELWDIPGHYSFSSDDTGKTAQKTLIADIEDMIERVYGAYEAKH